MVRWILGIALFGVAAAAAASIPTGRRIGPSHVTGITSIEGSGLGDAAAVLIQETQAGRIEVGWEQGGPSHVAIDIDHCRGDDEEFDRGYSVPVERWLRLRGGGGRGLREDFTAWIAQARREYREGTRLDLFRLDRIEAAAAEFTARLRALDLPPD